MRFIIILLLSLQAFAFIGCTDERDCVGCNLSPRIHIRFEPVNMRRQVSATLNEIITEARQLRDSLIVSGLSEFQRSVIQSALAGLRTDSITFAELNRQFNTGRTRLDVVSAKGAGELSPWQDTLINNLRLPVDIQSDTTTYYFSFHGFSDTLQVYYQRNISQTLDGMRMQLTGVGVNQQATSFDSLVVRCFGRICSNDRTTIFIYY